MPPAPAPADYAAAEAAAIVLDLKVIEAVYTVVIPPLKTFLPILSDTSYGFLPLATS